MSDLADAVPGNAGWAATGGAVVDGVTGGEAAGTVGGALPDTLVVGGTEQPAISTAKPRDGNSLRNRACDTACITAFACEIESRFICAPVIVKTCRSVQGTVNFLSKFF